MSRSRSNSPSRKNSFSGQHQQKSTAELLQSLADAHAQQQNGASWGAVVSPLGFNLKKTATAFLSQVEKSWAPRAPAPPPVNTFDIPRSGYTAPSKSKNH